MVVVIVVEPKLCLALSLSAKHLSSHTTQTTFATNFAPLQLDHSIAQTAHSAHTHTQIRPPVRPARPMAAAARPAIPVQTRAQYRVAAEPRGRDIYKGAAAATQRGRPRAATAPIMPGRQARARLMMMTMMMTSWRRRKLRLNPVGLMENQRAPSATAATNCVRPARARAGLIVAAQSAPPARLPAAATAAAAADHQVGKEGGKWRACAALARCRGRFIESWWQCGYEFSLV